MTDAEKWYDALLTVAPSKPRPVPSGPVTESTDARARHYAEKALNSACQTIATAPEGTRNDTLNRESFSIGGLVQGGYINAATAYAELTQAGMRSGLPEDEANRTVARALDQAEPRPLHLEDNIATVSNIGYTPTADAIEAAMNGATAGDDGVPRRRITLVKASTVRTERLDWLIDSWVPRRSMTLLAGREGLGKSTIACDFAAQATRGELDGKPMNVAYLNTEDSRSITVAPRLLAAGADMDRVFFFDVTTEAGHAGSLQLPGDTHLLAEALTAEGVGLVILDAAKSAMHASLDGYRDDDVRQFLEPLAAMCDEHDMSIIGLVHFGKRESNDPGKLILGSVAWSQIARSVLSVAVNDEGTLVITNTKGNLAPSQVSREARLESVTVPTDDGRDTSVGRVVWGDETNVSAADLLVSHDDDQDDERTEAEEWLEDYLKGSGPTPRLDVLKDAQKQRIASERTIKRAFKSIGGVSERSGFPAVAVWSLPDGPRGIDYTPVHVGAGPTGPTGADLHKQGGPTVGEEKGRGPTSGPPALTSGNNADKGVISPVGPLPTRTAQQPDPTGARPNTAPVESAILDQLSPDHPLSMGTIMRTVKELTGDATGVPDELDRLAAAGVIVEHPGMKYTLAPSE